MKPIPTLAALASALALTSSAFAAKFVTNQDASVVLGQTTFAGNDPGIGLPNRFYNPEGIALDAATGKVFVADSNNNRVLRFSSAAAAQNGGNPELVFGQENFSGGNPNQGGAATKRSLNFPWAIQVDESGTLWIADSINNRVLGFYLASSLNSNNPPADFVIGQPDFTTVTTGTTAAKMSNPCGLSVGTDGTLWVADTTNSRVLRFENAPSATAGSSANGVLGQANLTSGAGATAIDRMNFPYAVHADSAGRLWVADTNNNRVLRFDSAVAKATPTGGNPDGVLGQPDFVTNTLGTNAASLNNTYGVALDASGTLWVGDYSNHRVLGFTNAASLANGAAATLVLGQPNLTTVDNPPLSTAKTIGGPSNVALGPNGSLLVADYDANRVVRFDPINAPGLVLTTKTATTAAPSYLVKGKATGSITSVSYRVGKSGAFKKAAGTANWKFTAKLKPGKNEISVYATGPGGNSATKKITITRK